MMEPLRYSSKTQTRYFACHVFCLEKLSRVYAWTSPSAPDSNAALSVSVLVFPCQVYLNFLVHSLFFSNLEHVFPQY